MIVFNDDLKLKMIFFKTNTLTWGFNPYSTIKK